jgi:hypothetical protein
MKRGSTECCAVLLTAAFAAISVGLAGCGRHGRSALYRAVPHSHAYRSHVGRT